MSSFVSAATSDGWVVMAFSGGAPETRLTLTAIFMPGVTQERSPQAASRALWQAV